MACLFPLMLVWGAAHAEGRVAYWLALRSNLTIDKQVARQLGENAGMIVLRADDDKRLPPEFSYANTFARIKAGAPRTPVLLYALATRLENRGRIDRTMLQDLNLGKPLAVAREDEGAEVDYLNIVDPKVRSLVVERLLREAKQIGADGIAVDGATRRPLRQPEAIAAVCEREAGFCDRYASALDSIVHDLNVGMGDGKTILVNGLRNYEPGLLEDQVRLVEQADAVIIEFFGKHLGKGGDSFERNVLPYIGEVQRLPPSKPALFFGRGQPHYNTYAADFQWQRYLFASFLLGARDNDLFKYHSTFQVPTSRGRSGGLDSYADWQLPLGRARGGATQSGGLYRREFENGLVVVAPLEGRGGTLQLDRGYVTPEGANLRGAVRVAQGTGLLLLKAPPPATPVSHAIDASAMSDWGWTNVAPGDLAGRPALKLSPLPEALEGDHDLRLDYQRSLTPYSELEVRARLDSPEAAIYAVAEVDDPKRQNFWLVVRLGREGGRAIASIDPVDFRTPPGKAKTTWPMVSVAHRGAARDGMVLDGPLLAQQAGYVFRRWAHIRFDGAMTVGGVTLGKPMRPID